MKDFILSMLYHFSHLVYQSLYEEHKKQSCIFCCIFILIIETHYFSFQLASFPYVYRTKPLTFHLFWTEKKVDSEINQPFSNKLAK